MCYLFFRIFHMYYSQTEKQNSITKRKTKFTHVQKSEIYSQLINSEHGMY